MKTSLFLPKEIKVGFQERSSTYTGKLAYVIYIDEKGKVRKEVSFENWRNKNIDVEDYQNEPMSGFVLNKNVGGYDTGWNHRNAYIRVYDPRGFEFEISIENLLYILNNTSSVIGKGLEGEFVYAWDGKDLVLLPVNAPEYKELKELNELRYKKNFVKAKDLKVGATYLTKKNEKLVYLGKFDEYEHSWRNHEPMKLDKKQFYFSYLDNKDGKYGHVTFPSIAQKLIQVVDDGPHFDLALMTNSLEDYISYCPIDKSKTERKLIPLDKFIDKNGRYGTWFVAQNGKQYYVRINPYRNNEITITGESKILKEKNWMGREIEVKKEIDNMYDGEIVEFKTLEDVYDILQPHETYHYQENGNLHSVDYTEWNEHV